MYKCKCGKEYLKSQSYVAHCGHCKVNLGYDPKDRFGDSRAWSRGLTKETDSRVKRLAELPGVERGNFRGHTHTEETKSRLSNIGRYNAKNHLNGWKAGSNRVPNKYEKFVEELLISEGIPYQREVVVPQSSLGKKGGYYQLDFLICGVLDLEIDGSSHSESYDEERDHYISKVYSVYRIRHNDSLEELEVCLRRFLSNLRIESREGSSPSSDTTHVTAVG